MYHFESRREPISGEARRPLSEVHDGSSAQRCGNPRREAPSGPTPELDCSFSFEESRRRVNAGQPGPTVAPPREFCSSSTR